MISTRIWLFITHYNKYFIMNVLATSQKVTNWLENYVYIIGHKRQPFLNKSVEYIDFKLTRPFGGFICKYQRK